MSRLPTTPCEQLKLDNQLCFKLYAASRAVIRAYKPMLDALGLTYPQYVTLLALWERDGQSVRELGEALQLDSGTLSPLLRRMAEADLFVLPSFAEGLPVVLMEAMASGLPVIATNIAGIPELVEDNVTGRLVEAGDERQLARAMRDCLTMPLPALTMARQGQIRASRDHDMWTEARRLARFLQASDNRPA